MADGGMGQAKLIGCLADALMTGRRFETPQGFERRQIGPIAKIETSRVQGTVTLANNELQVTPDSPVLRAAKGAVVFSEKGFSVVGADEAVGKGGGSSHARAVATGAQAGECGVRAAI